MMTTMMMMSLQHRSVCWRADRPFHHITSAVEFNQRRCGRRQRIWQQRQWRAMSGRAQQRQQQLQRPQQFVQHRTSHMVEWLNKQSPFISLDELHDEAGPTFLQTIHLSVCLSVCYYNHLRCIARQRATVVATTTTTFAITYVYGHKKKATTHKSTTTCTRIGQQPRTLS